MSLITPDFGLFFWMAVIFGAVFFILAKFGFPVITKMVDKRSEKIEKSLENARQIEIRMNETAAEQRQILESARREQALIIKEAGETKNKIISEARERAREEASQILSEARAQIAAEKETALTDIRREVALISVQVAEQILRKDLSKDSEQREFLDKMVTEATHARIDS